MPVISGLLRSPARPPRAPGGHGTSAWLTESYRDPALPACAITRHRPGVRPLRPAGEPVNRCLPPDQATRFGHGTTIADAAGAERARRLTERHRLPPARSVPPARDADPDADPDHPHHHLLPRHRARPAGHLARHHRHRLRHHPGVHGAAGRALDRSRQRRQGDVAGRRAGLRCLHRLLGLAAIGHAPRRLQRAARLRPHVLHGRPSDAGRARRRRAQPRRRARLLHGRRLGGTGAGTVRGRLARRRRGAAADAPPVHHRPPRRRGERDRRARDPSRPRQGAAARARRPHPGRAPAQAARLLRRHGVERGDGDRARPAGDLSAGAGGGTADRLQRYRPAADGTLDRLARLAHVLCPADLRLRPHPAHAHEHARQRRGFPHPGFAALAAGHVSGARGARLRHGHRLDAHALRGHVSRAARGLRHRAHAAHDRQSRRADRVSRAGRSACRRHRRWRHPAGAGRRPGRVGGRGRAEPAAPAYDLTRRAHEPRPRGAAMPEAIQIRMGGYGPASTGFSRALKRIGDRLTAELGERIAVKYVWNIMDLGYRADDILWLVEHGLLTLGYQSSSYLTDRVPELGLVDLPFPFADTQAARAAMDGALGDALARAIEARTNFRILGWFENGFRHISNRVRPLRAPADLAGLRIRVLPSQVQARTFELLGAVPMRMDLTEAIAMITAGTIDAQENPLSNTVTYGVHKFHRFHTLSGHFYISRPIFVHRTAFDASPPELQRTMRAAVTDAIAFQRDLHVEEEEAARSAIAAQGCEIVELTAAEHRAFAAAVALLLDEARATFSRELFALAANPAA